MPEVPQEFAGVTIATRANVYFDGKVVSHSITLPDQSRKTLGLIFPGTYHFGTKAAEIMEIVNGRCEVTLDGAGEKRGYGAGQRFEVPADSGFTIEVGEGICEYICSFVS